MKDEIRVICMHKTTINDIKEFRPSKLKTGRLSSVTDWALSEAIDWVRKDKNNHAVIENAPNKGVIK